MSLTRFIAILMCLAAFSCAKKPEQAAKKEEPQKKIVLEVGSTKLSGDEINVMFGQLPLEQRTRYLADKEKAKVEFIDDLAQKQLFVLAARDQKFAEQPAVHAMLDMAENSVLYSAYYREEILDKIVPEKEIRQFYDANKDRFFHPEQVHVRHILVTPRPGQQVTNSTGDDAKNEAEAKKKIDKIVADLKAGAKFEDEARMYSEDPSAAQGGELDWFARGRMVKAFDDAAFSIPQPGGIAGPIKSDFGYHLIQLLERRERTYFSYDDVRNEIQNQLANQRSDAVQKAYEKLLQDLQKRYPKKVNLENLK
ncbi:MAG TPA: peptidylprolyl isomerase [Acidobacteriota bacterium]|nr:peptidylprolyl isomerase [Acidobacteriota bacterium]